MPKIMLCDDSRTVLNLFEKKLKDAGYEVVAKARDGEEGIKVYSEVKPDLILLDVTMPNKDGRECLEGIMKLNAKAKVIMVSALKDDSVVTSCLNGGAKAFISKEKLYKDDDFKKDVLTVIETVLKAS